MAVWLCGCVRLYGEEEPLRHDCLLFWLRTKPSPALVRIDHSAALRDRSIVLAFGGGLFSEKGGKGEGTGGGAPTATRYVGSV